ncbi:MAG: chromosome segregation protein SMC, partial [Chloroflexota bacterium]|nr:chromosome segregation protein SMC [Chloroflexota bacterium]
AWQAVRAAVDDAEAAVTGGTRAREQGIARRAQVVDSLAGLREGLAALRRELAEAERSLNVARDADQRANAERVDAEQELAAARAELLERERRTVAAGGRLVELEGALHAAAVDASRAEQELGALDRERDQAFEAFSLGEPGQGREQPPDVTVAEADEPAALDEESLIAELRRVRRTLAQLGAVNPFAVEEHREVAGRLDELTTQDEDLRTAIASTEELIATLDREIGDRFHTAFAAIGRRFNEYCRLLFAGGSASLRVSDGTDGEASGGIEIVVQPPGKRLQRLSMLSGGERALAGVALLFSMLSVNPVPFCILDEVDAALDEANIGRFAEALRTLSAQIDFVVITHNRATIEVADTIYGVTMTDAAVSRVLSLRLADVPVGATA